MTDYTVFFYSNGLMFLSFCSVAAFSGFLVELLFVKNSRNADGVMPLFRDITQQIFYVFAMFVS